MQYVANSTARHDYERALETAQLASDGSMEWQSMMALGFLWAERDYAQAGAWFRRVSEQASPLTLGLRTSWSWKD